MDMRKVGPPPLEAKVAVRLLDLLSTDDEFRELFARDAKAALIFAGYVQPAAVDGITAAGPGDCMQIRASDRLASKEQIIRERVKLERTLNAIQHFDCPTLLLAP